MGWNESFGQQYDLQDIRHDIAMRQVSADFDELTLRHTRKARRISKDGPLVKQDRSSATQNVVAVLAHFASSRPPSDISIIEAGTCRSWLGHLLYSPVAETVVATAIAFNFLLTIVETDARAANVQAGAWVVTAGRVCLGVFTLELIVRACVERTKLLQNNWNRLDVAIVVTGLVEMILESLSTNPSVSLSMLRIARLLRLGRTLKAMNSLREVRYLVQMMVTCMRTLFWAFFLTFLLMTMWSVMIVELVHPLVRELVEDDPGCESVAGWSLSFSSVMRSNLTLFQTIVAGDSWGRVAVPVIVAHPWTAPLFFSALLSIVFGVLNLIVAVVVDSAAEARQLDDSARAAHRAREETLEKKALQEIFDLIDADRSGSLTFDELQLGVDSIPAFRDRLRGMDVGKDDLQELFSLIDDDGNGEIDTEEFIEALYRMKCVDSKTALTLVKHYVVDIKKRTEGFATKISAIDQSVCACMQALGAEVPTEKEKSLIRVSSPLSGATSLTSGASMHVRAICRAKGDLTSSTDSSFVREAKSPEEPVENIASYIVHGAEDRRGHPSMVRAREHPELQKCMASNRKPTLLSICPLPAEAPTLPDTTQQPVTPRTPAMSPMMSPAKTPTMSPAESPRFLEIPAEDEDLHTRSDKNIFFTAPALLSGLPLAPLSPREPAPLTPRELLPRSLQDSDAPPADDLTPRETTTNSRIPSLRW